MAAHLLSVCLSVCLCPCLPPDNSEYTRNGDVSPTRFEAQVHLMWAGAVREGGQREAGGQRDVHQTSASFWATLFVVYGMAVCAVLPHIHQLDSANLICGAKTQQHPENSVGIMTMAGERCATNQLTQQHHPTQHNSCVCSVEVRVTPTVDLGKMLSGLSQVT